MHAGDPPRANDIRPNVSGIDFAIERPHTLYGSAIFVTSGTIVNATSLTEVNNIEILRVDLRGISVTSVYKPLGERFSFHQPLTAAGDQHHVIIGDFNSHSSTRGYATGGEGTTLTSSLLPTELPGAATRL